MQTKKVVKTASANDGKFLLGIEKNASSSLEYVEADYLLIASGSSSQVGLDIWPFLAISCLRFKIIEICLFFSQGYSLASQLGHSIVDPVPSLFTFKTADSQLTELSGVMPVYKLHSLLMISNGMFVVTREIYAHR